VGLPTEVQLGKEEPSTENTSEIEDDDFNAVEVLCSRGLTFVLPDVAL
jgi:hypothetical protein